MSKAHGSSSWKLQLIALSFCHTPAAYIYYAYPVVASLWPLTGESVSGDVVKITNNSKTTQPGSLLAFPGRPFVGAVAIAVVFVVLLSVGHF